MTKKLSDLFTSFGDMTDEEQYAKIRTIRDTRSIERPAVAKRRKKKAVAKSDKQKTKATKLLMNLTEEERAELIRKLTGG